MPLVWTESMRNGVDAFDKNSVLDNDKRLAAWVKLQMIAEEVETLRTKASLAVKVQGEVNPSGLIDQPTLSSLESRFSRWRDDSQLVFNGKRPLVLCLLSCGSRLTRNLLPRLAPHAFLLLPHEVL